MELCDSLKQAEFICNTGHRIRNLLRGTISRKVDATQKYLATMPVVPVRTYQNWEQPEESREHRRIPDEPMHELESLSHSPQNLIVDGSFFSF